MLRIPYRRAVQVAVLLAAPALQACEGEPAAREENRALEVSRDAEPPSSAAPVTAPTARPPAEGCLRGGTPRAEVQALLGQPDSVSWGVWLYGRSEIAFGYGVVVSFADHDGNLQVCEGA